MIKRVSISAVTIIFSAALVSAQGPRRGMPPEGGPMGMGPGNLLRHEKVVSGAPYSADVSNQWSQTLADGNVINHTTTGHVARDSQGRVYSQETISGGPFASGPVTFTTIFDPVAGYVYRLNPTTKIATRMAIPPFGTNPDTGNDTGRGHGPNGQPPNRPDSSVTMADLGTQTIAGVSATGTSRTRTIPANAIGNAQPIVSTSEVWTSPDLQVVVLAKRNDPRTGQSTYSLTNIQRSEAAASLFQVPADYTVQDAQRGMHGMGPGPVPPPAE